MACAQARPGWVTLPCPTFEDAFAAVSDGAAGIAMIAIENSLAGRVADIHYLLPHSGLSIVGEHFMPIHFHLMGPKGAKLEGVKFIHSHVHALGQCRKIAKQLGAQTIVAGDTAGSGARNRPSAMIPRTLRSPRQQRRRSTGSTCSPRMSKTITATPPASC